MIYDSFSFIPTRISRATLMIKGGRARGSHIQSGFPSEIHLSIYGFCADSNDFSKAFHMFWVRNLGFLLNQAFMLNGKFPVIRESSFSFRQLRL